MCNAETSVNPGLILRQKKKAESSNHPIHVGHTEEAVITHRRHSPGLLTPFEEVAVSFQTKSSNVKRSFPVTHQQLLTEEDLSSPEASDDDSEEEEEREIGFESMGMEKFEQFGNPLVPLLPGGTNTKSLDEEQALQVKLSVSNQLDVNKSSSQEMDEEDQKRGSSEANDEDAVAVEIDKAELKLPPEIEHKESHLRPSPQIQQPSSNGNSDEEQVDSVAELREIADSASVQKRLSLFQRKEQRMARGLSEATTRQPSDLGMLKRGGVSARLKMFEDLEDGLEPQRPVSPPPSPRALRTPTKLPTTIIEEDEEDEEMEDSVAPLPCIRANKTKHEEKHKMDGLSPEIVRKRHSPSNSPSVAKESFKSAPVLAKASPFSQPTEPFSRKKEKKPAVSPLLMSSNAKLSSTTTPLSNAEILWEEEEEEEAKKEESAAIAMQKNTCPLLQKPKLSGASVPHKFKSLDLSSGALTVWQVKVHTFNFEYLALSNVLHKITYYREETFDVFIPILDWPFPPQVPISFWR